VKVTINQEKIIDDARWDGWKGYITNTELAAQEVIERYHDLWYIERAYRITKGTLEIRPVFHFTPRRIEAHVCICFVAYKVYRELERLLATEGFNMSVDKVLSIAGTVASIRVRQPHNDSTMTQTLLLTPAYRRIAPYLIWIAGIGCPSDEVRTTYVVLNYIELTLIYINSIT
jgi:hypothetical protein